MNPTLAMGGEMRGWPGEEIRREPNNTEKPTSQSRKYLSQLMPKALSLQSASICKRILGPITPGPAGASLPHVRQATGGSGGAATSALASRQRRSGSDPRRGPLPDFRMRESCRTTPLAGGFSRDTPVLPALAFQRRSILGSRFVSCSGTTGTHGSQLGSLSLGGEATPSKLLRYSVQFDVRPICGPAHVQTIFDLLPCSCQHVRRYGFDCCDNALTQVLNVMYLLCVHHVLNRSTERTSKGIMFGLRGGHTICPPLPIHLFGNRAYKRCFLRTTLCTVDFGIPNCKLYRANDAFGLRVQDTRILSKFTSDVGGHPAVRQEIMQLHPKYLSYRRIVRILSLGFSSLRYAMKRFKDTGNTDSKLRPGRPTKCREWWYIVRKVMKTSSVSATSLAAHITLRSSEKVSAQAIRNELYSTGLQGRSAREKQFINESNRQKYMASTGIENTAFTYCAMDAQMYVDVLRHDLPDSLHKLDLEETFHFQQDHDPKHDTLKTRMWLIYNTPRKLNTPPHKLRLKLLGPRCSKEMGGDDEQYGATIVRRFQKTAWPSSSTLSVCQGRTHLRTSIFADEHHVDIGKISPSCRTELIPILIYVAVHDVGRSQLRRIFMKLMTKAQWIPRLRNRDEERRGSKRYKDVVSGAVHVRKTTKLSRAR
ncbi:hypothetical protein PR048_011151 [Dryococelus australis]|uniref:Uncharacterized protein n=1 Tax=Dryococelus australis TaxID=614101 RepID=A0ABQ9HKR6_9NEOP|nr:hypothetical protein PR048_011151 [Dryococelus australis]